MATYTPEEQITNKTYTDPTTGKTSYTSGISSVVNSSVLSPVFTPTPPPATPDTTNYSGIIQGAATNTNPATQTSSDSTPYTDLAKKVLGDITANNNDLTGKTAYEQSQLDTSGATALESRQKELAARITAINNETNAIPLKLQQASEGRGITTGGLAPIQTAALRNNAIQALSINSEYALNAGQLDTAKQQAQRAVDLKYKDLEDSLDRNTKLLGLYTPFMTAEQKKIADAQQLKNDAAKTDLVDKKKQQADVVNAAQLVGDSASAGKALQLDPSSATFKDDLASIQSGLPQDQLRTLQIAKAKVDLAKAQKDYADSNNPGPALPQDYTSFLNGRTTTQVKAFNDLSGGDKSVVAQLVNGDALLSDIVKSRGASGTKDIQRYIQEATAIDPNFSINTNKVRYNFLQQWNNPNGKASITRNAINTALGHLADFKTNADALDSGSLRKLNSVKNILSTETGDPKVLQLRTDINALASEIATIYKGGQPTDSEIKNWEETIAANFSKNQFKGVSEELSKLLSSKITATRYQYKSAMGNEYSDSLIDPDKRTALFNAGINPDSLVKENVPLTTENNAFTQAKSTNQSIFNVTGGFFNIPSHFVPK